MRKSTLFFFYIAFNLILMTFIFSHAALRQHADLGFIHDQTDLVKKLQLTDICLFTEAGYTRHLSQADFNTPFQDSPMSLEHFPSGSLVGIPKSLRKQNGKMD